MQITDIQQNTPEWKEWRKRKIGASDIPLLMGEGYCKLTLRQWWALKTGREQVVVNDAMKRGHEIEPIAREIYEEENLTIVTPQIHCHDQYDWAVASLDGVTMEGRLVEFKAFGEKKHSMVAAGQVPPEVYGQCQWQMSVYGETAQEMDLVSCDRYENKTVVVKRDDAYIERAWSRVFHVITYLLEDREPPTEARDIVMRDDAEWKIAATELRDLLAAERERKKEWKPKADRIAELKSLLKEMASGQASAGGGIRVALTTQNKLDQKRLIEETGVDLSPYMYSQAIWKVEIDKQ